ncbi:MAG: hypothetical protein HON16_05725 [Euryarchaeota archaeon]|nr:hypothetical protein [Euryarchaeota archaeon]
MSTNAATTILDREENSGKKYPMIVEKLILLLGVALFIFTCGEVFDMYENIWISSALTFMVYPFTILFTTEVLGRIIQRVHNDS